MPDRRNAGETRLHRDVHDPEFNFGTSFEASLTGLIHASRLKVAAYKLLHGFDAEKGTRKDSIEPLRGSERIQFDQSPAFGCKVGYKLILVLQHAL